MKINSGAFFEQTICSMKERYQNNTPYPLIVVDNLWSGRFLTDINSEFQNFEGWCGEKDFYGAHNKKYCNNLDIIPEKTGRLIQYLNSYRFIEYLEQLTSINKLKGDKYLIGGGMHSTGRNGYLKLHVDFNWNEKIKLYRRLNLLIYINPNWQKEWRGDLWFATRDKKNKTITPRKKVDICFNRTVIFETTKETWHGHPFKLNCPDNIRRNSIAMYYYTQDKKTDVDNKRESTLYERSN